MVAEQVDASAPLQDALLLSTMRYDPQLKGCNANPTVVGQPTGFYLITYHHQRLIEAAEHLGFSDAITALGNIRHFHHELKNGLKKATELGIQTDQPIRMRVTVSRQGKIETTCQKIPDVSLDSLFPESFTGYDDTQTHGNYEASARKSVAGNYDTLSVQPPKAQPPNLDSSKPTATCTPWAVVVSPVRTLASPITTFKHDIREIYDSARNRAQGEYDSSTFANFDVLLVDRESRILDGSISTVYFRRNGIWVTPPTGIGDGRWGALKSVTRRWALERGLAMDEHIDADSVVEGERVWLSNGAKGFFPGVVVLNPLRAS